MAWECMECAAWDDITGDTEMPPLCPFCKIEMIGVTSQDAYEDVDYADDLFYDGDW